MNNKLENNNDELNFINKYQYHALVTLVLVVALYAFLYSFFEFKIKDINSAGVIGDFFGGVLNPIFALIGLFALLQTIRIQSQELKTSSKALKNSHEELQLTREEAQLSRKALQQQSESIKLQNFENTFFNMINLHNEIVKSLKLENTTYVINDIINDKQIYHLIKVNNIKTAKEVLIFLNNKLQKFLIKFNSIDDYTPVNNGNDLKSKNQVHATEELYLIFHEKFQEYIGHYLRNIYQILKFISNADVKSKKFYSNILRTQLSDSELNIIFCVCITNKESEKAIPLLAEFEMFEHLQYNENISKKDIITYIKMTIELKKGYSPNKIFGNNKEWKQIINSLI